MSNKTALIIGATGLTGSECLKLLLQSTQYSKVIALTRKSLDDIPSNMADKLENILPDFDKLEQYSPQLKADHVYCAMGTTIGKAGNQEAFKKVDYEIPLQMARIALVNGAKKFILVSSMGADANSNIFYARVKGELENALIKLNYESLIIFRPSILLGDRKEKRYGEAIGRFMAEKLAFLFSGPLAKYKGTPVRILARAMVNSGIEKTSGLRIVENKEIFALAEK